MHTELYHDILTDCAGYAEEQNSITKKELERIYQLAFCNCLLYLLQEKIKTEMEVSERETESGIQTVIIFSDGNEFLCSKDILTEYLHEKYQDIPFKSIITEEITDAGISAETETDGKEKTSMVNISEALKKTDHPEMDHISSKQETEDPTVKKESVSKENDTVQSPMAAPEVEIIPEELLQSPEYDESASDNSKEENPCSARDVEEDSPIQSTDNIQDSVTAETIIQDTAQQISEQNFYICTEFPDDSHIGKKRQDSFVYDQYLIDTGDLKIRVNIFPLRYMKSAPVSSDIFIVFKGNNGTYRGYKSSKNGNKLVRAAFDKYEFIARGKWINGKFETSLTLSKPAEIQIQKKEHRPDNPAATTHMILNKNGNELHIFPSDWVNNPKTGVAGAIIYSETEDAIMMPNPQTQIPYSKKSNEILQVYWQGTQDKVELIVTDEQE